MARFEDRFPPLPGHPPRLEPPSAWPWSRRGALVRVVVAAGVAVLLLLAVLVLPRLLLDWDLAGATVADRAAAVGAVRASLLQAVGGLVVVVGAVLTWRQLQVHRSAQVTDAFAAAIAHLGDPSLDVRLGGLYALERVARTSPGDRRPVEEVLCLFVRNHAEEAGTDVEVAMRVLARRRPAGGPLALDRVRLPGVRLRHARLACADLHFAHLDRAQLFAADLTGADLTGCSLRDAVLIDAVLHQADLRDAVLTGAIASNADLRAADLSGADLTGGRLDGARLDQADLRGADLTGAAMDGATLAGAVVDDGTRWPTGFTPRGTTRTDLPLRPRTYREATR